MPNDNNNQALGPEDIAEIIKMQRREDAGKSTPRTTTTTRGVNIKARNFATPAKPIFEGKSISEVMQRRNSDSTTMSQKLAEMDDDEISLSSVQNMPTIPSVTESPGLFGMLANFSRFTSTPKTNKAHVDDTHRIGELPNKAKIQQLAQAPVHMVELQQNSGSTALPEGENSNSSKGKSVLLHPRSSNSNRTSVARSAFQSLKDGTNDGLGDDDFFAALDGDGANSSIPSTLEEGNSTSINNATTATKSTATTDSTTGEKARERRKKRGNAKPAATEPKSQVLTPSSNIEVTSSTDFLSSESQDDVGLLSTPSPDWTPIVPFGTRVQRPKVTSTIDESEHSLSSIIAKRRPLAKETLLAQEMARKQHEALAALMAQSTATLDLEEMDESVASSHPDERPTANHDWQEVVDETYTKKVLRPLAHSVDDDDDDEASHDDDAFRLKPQSRELQKIQGQVDKQKEQLRSIVQATPDAYQALLETAIMTKKEADEVTRTRGDWQDVSEDTKKSQLNDPTRRRDFFEDNDTGEEILPRPASRDARQLDEVARKQRRQVRSTMESTPDATSAIEPTKVLSEKEKQSTRKTNDQWHDVKANSAEAMLNISKESPNDENDQNERGRHKSRRMRSLEETAKKQKETVENLILDQVRPEEDLEKVRGRQEQRDYRSGNDWHDLDVDKQKSHEKTIEKTNESYPSIENATGRQSQNDSTTTGNKQIDISPSKSKSKSPSLPSKARPQSKKQEYGPTSAYPVSDAPLEREDDSSNNALPVLRKKIPQFEGNQPISDPDESESLVKQSRQEWYGVDAEPYPLNSKGFYKQVAKDTDKDTTGTSEVGSKSPATEVAPSKSKPKPSASSSKTKMQSKRRDMSPTNAYPVLDATSERDHVLSTNLPPVSTTTIVQMETIQSTRVPGEMEPSRKQTRQDWHGVNTAQHPSQQKGFYKDVEPVGSSTEKSEKDHSNEVTEGRSSGTTAKVNSREKSTSNRSVENSSRKRNNSKSSGKRTNSKSPKSRSKISSKNRISDNEVTNVMWQRVSSHHSTNQKGELNEGKVSIRNRKGSDKETTSFAKSSQCTNEVVADIDLEMKDPSVLNEVESFEGPFNKRPELNPFNHRPLNGKPGVMQQPAIFVTESIEERHHDETMTPGTKSIEPDENEQREDTKTLSGSDSGRVSPERKSDEQSDDNITNRSSEESRRKLLRKKVDDRREALTSIFHHTHEVSLNAENEILDLKRKLALSQAFVQRLEIENGELERRALLEFSDAQLKLLKQRDNREKELEERIKNLMQERDAAVLECHDLRILVNGSCDFCRQRFDHHREYFMDYSVRKTIISKRIGPQSSAFQWFTAGLKDEMQNASPESAMETTTTQNLDHDSSSLEKIVPDSQGILTSPVFPFVPFQWLSTKLIVNGDKGKQEDHHTQTERNNENSLQDKGQLISIHDSTSRQSAGDSQPNQVQDMPIMASNSSHGGNSLASLGEGNEGPIEDMVDEGSTELANKAIANPHNGSISNSTGSASPTQGLLNGCIDADKAGTQFAGRLPLNPNEQKKLEATTVQKGKSFFSSLFGEKVDEESEFAPGNFLGNTLKRFDSSSQKSSKFGGGLKDERVLDDMEILNSIMSISTPHGSNEGEKRRFGLGDERFNDDERDRRILGALSQSKGTSSTIPPISDEKKKDGITGLLSEKFNDDSRDAKLLSLLSQSEVGEPPLKEARTNSRATQKSPRPTSTSEMPTLSSSELSPRKRGSTNKGRRGASISGSYLGQFSNRTFNGQNKDTPRSPLPSSPLPSGTFNDPKSGSPLVRDSRLLPFHNVHIDVELEDERPWRSDTGLPRSKKNIVVDGDRGEGNVDPVHSTPHTLSTGSRPGKDEDLDQILALLAHEDA